MAIDAFIKFEGFEGDVAHKLGNGFDRLGDGFSDLGAVFLKLTDDLSSTDVKFFKADAADHIKHDIFAIDGGFLKIGADFLKLDGPLHKFDDTFVKFTDQFLKVTPPESEGSPSFAADFLKYEADVKMTGLDFLTAASDLKIAPTENLSLAFNKISVDYKNQSDDELKIATDAADFLKISGISESSKVGETFLKFSLDSVLISSVDLKLSTDFHKISTDLAAASDSGPMTFDQVVLKFSDDFVKLAQDLKLADGAFAALGGDTVKLAEAFEHPGPVIIPATTNG
jgi:hypothetical protein